MLYTLNITEFSERPDGQWLTTGGLQLIPNLDRAAVERLVAERSGPGIKFSVWASVGTEEAETSVGGTKLRWLEDETILEARDRLQFAAIAAAAEGDNE